MEVHSGPPPKQRMRHKQHSAGWDSSSATGNEWWALVCQSPVTHEPAGVQCFGIVTAHTADLPSHLQAYHAAFHPTAPAVAVVMGALAGSLGRHVQLASGSDHRDGQVTPRASNKSAGRTTSPRPPPSLGSGKSGSRSRTPTHDVSLQPSSAGWLSGGRSPSEDMPPPKRRLAGGVAATGERRRAYSEASYAQPPLFWTRIQSNAGSPPLVSPSRSVRQRQPSRGVGSPSGMDTPPRHRQRTESSDTDSTDDTARGAATSPEGRTYIMPSPGLEEPCGGGDRFVAPHLSVARGTECRPHVCTHQTSGCASPSGHTYIQSDQAITHSLNVVSGADSAPAPDHHGRQNPLPMHIPLRLPAIQSTVRVPPAAVLLHRVALALQSMQQSLAISEGGGRLGMGLLCPDSVWLAYDGSVRLGDWWYSVLWHADKLHPYGPGLDASDDDFTDPVTGSSGGAALLNTQRLAQLPDAWRHGGVPSVDSSTAPSRRGDEHILPPGSTAGSVRRGTRQPTSGSSSGAREPPAGTASLQHSVSEQSTVAGSRTGSSESQASRCPLPMHTPAFLPPEGLWSLRTHGSWRPTVAGDVWALGMLIWSVYNGALQGPWAALGPVEQATRVLAGDTPTLPPSLLVPEARPHHTITTARVTSVTPAATSDTTGEHAAHACSSYRPATPSEGSGSRGGATSLFAMVADDDDSVQSASGSNAGPPTPRGDEPKPDSAVHCMFDHAVDSTIVFVPGGGESGPRHDASTDTIRDLRNMEEGGSSRSFLADMVAVAMAAAASDDVVESPRSRHMGQITRGTAGLRIDDPDKHPALVGSRSPDSRDNSGRRGADSAAPRMDQQLCNLLRRCWQPDPRKRPGLEEVEACLRRLAEQSSP